MTEKWPAKWPVILRSFCGHSEMNITPKINLTEGSIWPVTVKRPSGSAVPGCCSVSIHFLWAILSTSTVQSFCLFHWRHISLILSPERKQISLPHPFPLSLSLSSLRSPDGSKTDGRCHLHRQTSNWKSPLRKYYIYDILKHINTANIFLLCYLYGN